MLLLYKNGIIFKLILKFLAECTYFFPSLFFSQGSTGCNRTLLVSADNTIQRKVSLSRSAIQTHCSKSIKNSFKIVLTYYEKFFSSVLVEIQGLRPRIWNFFEITWTIYSNSERSESFLVTECFFNLFLQVFHIW